MILLRYVVALKSLGELTYTTSEPLAKGVFAVNVRISVFSQNSSESTAEAKPSFSAFMPECGLDACLLHTATGSQPCRFTSVVV